MAEEIENFQEYKDDSFIEKKISEIISIRVLNTLTYCGLHKIISNEIGNKRYWICGGYAAYLLGTTFKYSDIDIFFHSEKSSKEDKLIDSIKYQFIGIQESLSIRQILKNFDLGWCQVALDIKNDKAIYHPNVYKKGPVINSHSRWSSNVYFHVKNMDERVKKYSERRLCH